METGRGDPVTLAHLVREWRERALLTQEELAERSGLSVGTIRGLESGRIRHPRVPSVRRLADALALSDADRAVFISLVRPGSLGDDASPPSLGQPAPPAGVIAGSGPLDLGRLIGAAVWRVAVRPLRWMWQSHKADGIAREFTFSPRVAEPSALLGQLSIQQRIEVARLLESPEFDSLLVQLTVAQLNGGNALRGAVRGQLRECLRLRQVPEIHLAALSNAVLAAMDEGLVHANQRVPRSETAVAWTARSGQVAAAAARNGDLLHELSTASQIDQKAESMRRQVADRYQHVRLPHLDLPSVDWDILYVPPTLVLDRSEAFEIDMADLLEPGGRSVVLGSPGAGKSTLVSRLAAALCRDPRDSRVAFVLVLRDLAARIADGNASFKDILRQAARVPHGVDFTDHELEYLLLNGRTVVFVDGLDELIDLSQRSHVIELVEGFARTYPFVTVVATSRQLGYGMPGAVPSTIRGPRTASLDPGTFSTVSIRQFNDAQVSGYASRWFEVARASDRIGSTAGPLAESFLQESRSISDLRANPLLLSLLCATYTRRQHIPRNRAEIYAQCSLAIFNQWDEDRGIKLEMRFRGWLRGAVRYLAWQMLEHSGQPEMPRRLVERLLVRFLEERGLSTDEADEEAERFLKFCSGRAWILTSDNSIDGEAVYGFAHRTFLEFYAADYLVANHETTDVIWRIMRSKLASGDWDMISQIVLQLVDQKNEFGANRILAMALEELSSSDSAVSGQLLTFAARALGHVRPSPTVTAQIVNLSIDAAYACPVERREFGFTDHLIARQQKADEPLFTILTECLEEACAEVVKTTSHRLARDISGDDHPLRAKALATAADLAHLIRERSFDHAFTWDDLAMKLVNLGRDIPLVPKAVCTLPSALPELDPTQLELILAAVGPSPVFRFGLSMRTVIPPRALLAFKRADPPESEAAAALCDALITAPLPWLESKHWHEQSSPASVGFALQVLDPEPEQTTSKNRLAQSLIISLSYLEAAALLGYRPRAGTSASVLIRMRALPSHAAFDLRIDLKAKVERILAGMPERYSAFLRAWTERDLSVIGSATT